MTRPGYNVSLMLDSVGSNSQMNKYKPMTINNLPASASSSHLQLSIWLEKEITNVGSF